MLVYDRCESINFIYVYHKENEIDTVKFLYQYGIVLLVVFTMTTPVQQAISLRLVPKVVLISLINLSQGRED